MNYVFKNNKDIEEFSEFFMPEYKLEYLEMDNDMQEPQSSSAIEFNDFKLPSYDLPSIYDGHMLESKRITSKNIEKDDMLLSSNLKSTWIYDDSSWNILNTKNANSNNEFGNFSINWINGNAKEEHSENDSGKDKIIQEFDNKEELWLSPKTNSFGNNNSNGHPLIHKTVNHQNSEGSDIKRWGRKQDIQAFKELRELSNREGVSFETFLDEESSLTEMHHFILFELAYKQKWKRTTQTMLNRIRSLCKNQTMSVRERKQLVRLRKEAKKKNKPFIIEEIAHFFPGKLVSTLKSCINP